MKNSDVPKLTRPLKSGEIIGEEDIYFYVNDVTRDIQWMLIGENHVGIKYDPATMVPMRRPITQSMEFICSKEKKKDISPTTLNTINTTETSR